jgi:predicted PurR-regulated permease PerM
MSGRHLNILYNKIFYLIVILVFVMDISFNNKKIENKIDKFIFERQCNRTDAISNKFSQITEKKS